MCASRLCSRHIPYEVHIVQATMNRFDDILGLSLFATAALQICRLLRPGEGWCTRPRVL